MPKIVDHDARRAELAAAVWRLASREGIDAVTMRGVAAEAGWSTGAVAHYFADKEELVLFAFETVADRVGRRIVIKPTWREHQSTGEDVVVTLDPGMAFGTGHHPTTRMCLEMLEEHVSPGMEVFDLGCGSGILSIAAARLGAARVVGLEIDSVAVNAARQNVHENGVGESVRVIEGTLPNPAVAPASFDLAVANISAKVVSELAGELVKAVRPGGTLIGSGILLERKQSVAEALGSAGAVVRHTKVDGDWIALVATAP